MANPVMPLRIRMTPFAGQPITVLNRKRAPGPPTWPRTSTAAATESIAVAFGPRTGGIFVRSRIRRWLSGLLVFVGSSVAVHGADIQISNPLRNRGFAVVLQGDRIVFRAASGST